MYNVYDLFGFILADYVITCFNKTFGITTFHNIGLNINDKQSLHSIPFSEINLHKKFYHTEYFGHDNNKFVICIFYIYPCDGRC